jgi:hypothetical protein
MPSIRSFYGIYTVAITRFPFQVIEDIAKFFDDDEEEQAEIWIEGTKPLVMAPGHKSSVMVRIKESPLQVLLITSTITFRAPHPIGLVLPAITSQSELQTNLSLYE